MDSVFRVWRKRQPMSFSDCATVDAFIITFFDIPPIETSRMIKLSNWSFSLSLLNRKSICSLIKAGSFARQSVYTSCGALWNSPVTRLPLKSNWSHSPRWIIDRYDRYETRLRPIRKWLEKTRAAAPRFRSFRNALTSLGPEDLEGNVKNVT